MEAQQTIAGVQFHGRDIAAAAMDSCVICKTPIEMGDEYAMVPVRALDAVEDAKAMRGETFKAWHEPVHWMCLLVRLATCAGFMRQRAEA